MKFAIIIIDMEKDFFEENPVLNKRKPALIKNINDLVGYARGKNAPIVWVRQEFKPDLSDAYLIMKENKRKITMKGTPGAEILDELDKKQEDAVIVKNRYSAFFKTELGKILESRQISDLIFAGINTHACVRMTAIDAYQRDFQVVLAKDCVASWDKKHHDITLHYLQKSMGIKALTNKQIKQAF